MTRVRKVIGIGEGKKGDFQLRQILVLAGDATLSICAMKRAAVCDLMEGLAGGAGQEFPKVVLST